MIAGAVYQGGIARTTDGVVYVSAVASGAVVPATAIGTKGKTINPPAKSVSLNGEVYVRFV